MSFKIDTIVLFLSTIFYSLVSPITSAEHALHEFFEEKQSPTETTIGPASGNPGMGDMCPHGLFQGQVEEKKRSKIKRRSQKVKKGQEMIDG